MSKIRCKCCGDLVESGLNICPHCSSSLDDIDFEIEKKNNRKRCILALVFSIFMFFGHQGEYLSYQYEIESESPWIISFGYACITFVVNFALASIIPFIIKIVNRKRFYKRPVLMYLINAIIITGIYILIYDYVGNYYQYGVIGIIFYSIISFLILVEPHERNIYLDGGSYNDNNDHFAEGFQKNEELGVKNKRITNVIFALIIVFIITSTTVAVIIYSKRHYNKTPKADKPEIKVTDLDEVEYDYNCNYVKLYDVKSVEVSAESTSGVGDVFSKTNSNVKYRIIDNKIGDVYKINYKLYDEPDETDDFECDEYWYSVTLNDGTVGYIWGGSNGMYVREQK